MNISFTMDPLRMPYYCKPDSEVPHSIETPEDRSESNDLSPESSHFLASKPSDLRKPSPQPNYWNERSGSPYILPVENVDAVKESSSKIKEEEKSSNFGSLFEVKLEEATSPNKIREGFQCDVCWKTFSNSYKLRRHSLIHSGTTPHQCYVCGKSFIGPYDLKRHGKVHTGGVVHNPEVKNHEVIPPEGHNCTECGKTFSNMYKLRRHQLTHDGSSSFKCDECGKYFISRYDLSRHSKVHSGGSGDHYQDERNGQAGSWDVEDETEATTAGFSSWNEMETINHEEGGFGFWGIKRKPLGACEENGTEERSGQKNEGESRLTELKVKSKNSSNTLSEHRLTEERDQKPLPDSNRGTPEKSKDNWSQNGHAPSYAFNGDIVTLTMENGYSVQSKHIPPVVTLNQDSGVTSLSSPNRNSSITSLAISNHTNGATLMSSPNQSSSVTPASSLDQDSSITPLSNSNQSNGTTLMPSPSRSSSVTPVSTPNQNNDTTLIPTPNRSGSTTPVTIQNGYFSQSENVTPMATENEYINRSEDAPIMLTSNGNPNRSDSASPPSKYVKQSESASTLHGYVNQGKERACVTCGKMFTDAYKLRRHSLIHSGSSQHRCEICNRCFIGPYDLKRHQLVHSAEKPHKCQDCGKAFARLHCLSDHELLHTRTLPFHCDICNKSFLRPAHYKRHLLTHKSYLHDDVHGEFRAEVGTEMNHSEGV